MLPTCGGLVPSSGGGRGVVGCAWGGAKSAGFAGVVGGLSVGVPGGGTFFRSSLSVGGVTLSVGGLCPGGGPGGPWSQSRGEGARCTSGDGGTSVGGDKLVAGTLVAGTAVPARPFSPGEGGERTRVSACKVAGCGPPGLCCDGGCPTLPSCPCPFRSGCDGGCPTLPSESHPFRSGCSGVLPQ